MNNANKVRGSRRMGLFLGILVTTIATTGCGRLGAVAGGAMQALGPAVGMMAANRGGPAANVNPLRNPVNALLNQATPRNPAAPANTPTTRRNNLGQPTAAEVAATAKRKDEAVQPGADASVSEDPNFDYGAMNRSDSIGFGSPTRAQRANLLLQRQELEVSRRNLDIPGEADGSRSQIEEVDSQIRTIDQTLETIPIEE